MADIDDLLGGLGQGPRLPLAPAEDVLARGDRLRRRQTQLVAGAGALLVLTAGAAFYAATSGDPDSDSLQPIAPPSVTTVTSAPVTPTLAPTPRTTSTPTTPVSTTAPTTQVSLSPTTPRTSAPATPAVQRVAVTDRVTLEGVGPLRIGMTYAQVEAATGQQVEVSEDLNGDGSCVRVALVGDTSGLSLTGGNGKLSLISVSGSRRTASGVAIGDSEARVREVYGASLKEETTDFGGTALTWLVVRPAGSDVELSMYLSQGKVADIGVGEIGRGTSPEGPCV